MFTESVEKREIVSASHESEHVDVSLDESTECCLTF